MIGWFVEIVRSNIPEYNDTVWENILIGPWPDTTMGQKHADHHANESTDVEDWCYGEAKAKGYNVDDVLIVHNPKLVPSYGVNAPVYTEGSIAQCHRCAREITLEDDGSSEPIWTSEETLHSCTPGPNDEDRYHSPEPEEA